MRKTAFIFATLLAFMVCLFPVPAALAGPEPTPHEDPALAVEESISLPMILQYGDAYALADLMRYLDADFKISEMDFTVYAPQLAYIMERFDILSSDIFTGMDGAQYSVQEAAVLLDKGDLAAARRALDEAARSSDEVQQLIVEVLAAADTVGTRLGVFDAVAGLKLRQAYQALLGGDTAQARQMLREYGLSDDEAGQLLARVTIEPGLVGDKLGAFSLFSSPRLNEAYERLLENILKLKKDNLASLDSALQEQLEAIAAKEETLIPTEITLEVDPIVVFVGDDVTASGRLTAPEMLLEGRAITVTLQDAPFTAQTGKDGTYSLQITVPYDYDRSMTLQAVYSPAGADKDTYRGCQSEPVTIETLFYETELDIETPLVGSPGLPLTVSGQVTSTGPAGERALAITIDGTAWGQWPVDAALEVEGVLSASLAPGPHRLTASVAADKRYAGVSREIMLDVVLLPVEMEIDVPSVTWAPHRIIIRGHIYRGADDIAGAAVQLVFRGEILTATTGSDGRFNIAMDMPLAVALAGPQDFSVSVQPDQPYYEPRTITGRIFTFNLVWLCIIAAALAALAGNWRRLRRYLARRTGPRPLADAASQTLLAPEAAPQPDLPAPLEAAVKDPGPRGRVVAAYLEAMAVVESVAPATMTYDMTLREFLNLARPALRGIVADSFARITTLTEMALYSGQRIGDETAQQARQLAAAVKAGRPL